MTRFFTFDRILLATVAAYAVALALQTAQNVGIA
ncbi:hypothetical protein DES42_107210 [Zavarzinia compransoris]|nr:hypothetical protein DES42_107210 [Zavarzinia compransoris]